jgi:ribosome-binding protein aMBF1 (putative translation factor)
MMFIIKVNIFMGRPPGRIQDRLFQMRLSEEFLERLDEWRGKQPDLPSRAEAIRRLTTAMLQILDKDHGEKQYSSQIRAARALLGWSQAKLARGAGIGLPTLQRIEQNEGVVKGNFSTVLKIQKVLEQAGIHFTDDEAGEIGVRLRLDKR